MARVPAGHRPRRHGQLTLREALISVCAERRRHYLRGGGEIRLAIPPEAKADAAPLSAAETAHRVAAGERHYREPYSALIGRLKDGEPVEVGGVLLREALHRARRPMPVSGRRFLLDGDNDVTLVS